ncbi:uncharacterized protein LOC121991173 [Zingiber officinale]|uniref:uncharacterized protein LOC121991173 n=1 Tax=Zingiber officinale TaxID=94328 RepID=UPI001C4B2D95|nr:uncharacterized protein LOC121991173 [Zingiber officinale]
MHCSKGGLGFVWDLDAAARNFLHSHAPRRRRRRPVISTSSPPLLPLVLNSSPERPTHLSSSSSSRCRQTDPTPATPFPLSFSSVARRVVKAGSLLLPLSLPPSGNASPVTATTPFFLLLPVTAISPFPHVKFLPATTTSHPFSLLLLATLPPERLFLLATLPPEKPPTVPPSFAAAQARMSCAFDVGRTSRPSSPVDSGMIVLYLCCIPACEPRLCFDPCIVALRGHVRCHHIRLRATAPSDLAPRPAQPSTLPGPNHSSSVSSESAPWVRALLPPPAVLYFLLLL